MIIIIANNYLSLSEKVKGIKGVLETNGGSICLWREYRYRSSTSRSLRLICDCPNTAKGKYICDYRGNPHVLGDSYVKNAPSFYFKAAKYISSRLCRTIIIVVGMLQRSGHNY